LYERQPLNPCRKRPEQLPETVILGKITWIVDKLIEIRSIEQQLSQDIESPSGQSNAHLLNRIQDLSGRVDALDLALDGYKKPQLPRRATDIAFERASA
jgi:hypothetical protein